LPEHGVHERCLAVVDVSDNGDISDAFFTHVLTFSFPCKLLRGDSTIPPKKKGTSICTEVPIIMIRYLGQDLHVCCGGAFLSIGDFKRYALTFPQGPETPGLDGAVVNENVATVVHLDEPEALLLVEPLHGTF
jgi:hypothetical protein